MPTRRKQIEIIQNNVESVVMELDALIEEMETSLENMPASIQEGVRGEAMQEKIDNLQGWSDSLQEIVDDVV